MKIKYLSYNQAKALCEGYQHLVGSVYDASEADKDIVRCVIVAPYSRILQWQFVRSLLHGVPYEEALAICPDGRYDVLVLPDQENRTNLSFRMKSLRDYLQESGIDPNPDMHHRIRIC